MDFRPHIMTWQTKGTDPVYEDGTGYEISPGIPGETISIPCRFYLGGVKLLKNEDNEVTNQIGKIRVDVDSRLPELQGLVSVTEGELVHFEGRIKDIYHGQLTWRLDV